jgi:hypothetical protein
MRLIAWLLVASLVLAVERVAATQSPGPADADPASEIQARVGRLIQRLRASNGVTEDGTWERVRDEIDGLFSGIAAAEPSDGVEDRLRRALEGHEPDPEHSRLPIARAADLRHGRSVVAAYVIVRGPHHDVAVVRGFAEGPDGRLHPVASLTEFDGHGLFLEELSSPVEGESWFIGWGRPAGAKDALARVRVFSFDGSQFRVLWSPPDMDRVSIAVTGTGYTLTHHTADVNPPSFVTDEFVLTPTGPDRVDSTIHEEPAGLNP